MKEVSGSEGWGKNADVGRERRPTFYASRPKVASKEHESALNF